MGYGKNREMNKAVVLAFLVPVITMGVAGLGVIVASPAIAQAVAPQADPQVAPQADPQVAPEVAPQVAPEVAPQAESQVAPEVAPQAEPQVAPVSAVPADLPIQVSGNAVASP